MDTRPDDRPEPVMLIIADISGYTRYMTANAKTLVHSQTIVTELIKAIIKQIELPMEVAKLEGDAVFLFCRKQPGQAGAHPWPDNKRVVGQKLLTFFRMFNEKVAELSASTACACRACAHIEKLRLKVVVHSGEALFHRVFNFVELAGVDVIIVHRLLKNSVHADQYLLLTEAARADLEFVEPIQWQGGAETYESLGLIKTQTWLPGGRVAEAPAAPPASFTSRYSRSFKLSVKLFFAPLTFPRGQLQSSGPGTPARPALWFALVTVLLTPIYVFIGPLFVLFHTLRTHGKEKD